MGEWQLGEWGTGLPVARGRRTGCSVAATSLRERSRSIPDPMPAVGRSLRPCATGGRSAGRLAGCGTRPRRRASGRPCPAHQHACRPGTPRARQRSRGPTGQLPTGAPPVSLPARCCLRAPQCRAQVRTTRRAIRIRARGTGGSPLKVIGYSASGQGYPGCAGETGWLSASGSAPRLRRHPWAQHAEAAVASAGIVRYGVGVFGADGFIARPWPTDRGARTFRPEHLPRPMAPLRALSSAPGARPGARPRRWPAR